MDKKKLLLELLETADNIRHRDKKEGKHSQKKGPPDSTGERKKHHNKMSFPSQNALCLLLKEGSLNQRSIAKQVQVTGQAISELMKKLESRELVLRTQGEQNNENIITLTPKGEEKARELEEKREKTAEILFRDFTKEEMESFLFLLNKVCQNQRDFGGKHEYH